MGKGRNKDSKHWGKGIIVLILAGSVGISACDAVRGAVEDASTKETRGRISLAEDSIKVEEVEQGVDFWIWVDKLIWTADEVPLFNADLSHRGKRELPRLEPYELEFDGAWYVESLDETRHPRDFDPNIFRPQHDYRDIRFALDNRWRSKRSSNALRLTPGRHRMRLTFYTGAPGGEADKQMRIMTNVIEFRILSPGDKVAEEEWFELAAGGRPCYRFSPKDVRSYHRAHTGEDLSYDELKRIYTDIALRESQARGDAYVLAEVVERALAFEQNDLIRLRLYTILGGAYWGQKKKYAPELIRRHRSVAAEAYLTGLRDVLNHDLPAEKPQQEGAYAGTAVHESPQVVGKLHDMSTDLSPPGHPRLQR